MKYVGQPPVTVGDYVIGCQKLRDVLEELKPLYTAHFAETEAKYLDAPYEPNYEQYAQTEDRDAFVLFTVRKGVTLVGYMQYYVYYWGHSKGLLHAKEDAFYLDPEHRGQGLAAKVLDFTEYFLQKLGCRYVGMTSKAPVGGANIGPSLQRRGYRTVAVYFVKELEK